MTLHEARAQVQEAFDAAHDPIHIAPALLSIPLCIVSAIVMLAALVS